MIDFGMVNEGKIFKALLIMTIKIVIIDNKVIPTNTLKASLVPVCLIMPL